MNNPLISIIVPIYNCQDVLSRCLESILAQTYDNYEVILINDGSTDDSEGVCLLYAQKSHKIVYLSKPNGGVSSARNRGLEVAVGDYIAFVDSDDWIEAKMLEEVVNVISETNVDSVRFGYWKEYKSSSNMVIPKQDKLLTHHTDMLRYNEECGCYGYAWAGVYSRKSLDSLRFDESLQWCEDHIFIYESFLCCAALYMRSLPLYHYTINETGQSLSTRIAPMDIIDVVSKEKSIFSKYGESINDLAQMIYYNKIYLSVELAYRRKYSYYYRKSLAALIDSRRIIINAKGHIRIFTNESVPFMMRDIILTVMIQVKDWFKSKLAYK